MIDTLILANVDFNKVVDIKLFRFIDSQVCATFQILLSLYNHVENQFLRIINNKGERAILYTKHGIIYIPECTEIKTIHIQEGENCYKEIPITFVHQNEELSGFLNKDYVILRIGNKIDCKIDSDIILFPEHDTARNWVQRIGTKIMRRRRSEFEWRSINILKNDINKLNLHHPDPIMIGNDELKQIRNLEIIQEQNNIFYVQPIADDFAYGKAVKWIESSKEKLSIPFIFFYLYLLV